MYHFTFVPSWVSMSVCQANPMIPAGGALAEIVYDPLEKELSCAVGAE